MPLHHSVRTDVIANGGTTSSGVEIDACELLGLSVPTLTSGTFKLQASADGGTNYRDIVVSETDPAVILQLSATTGGFCWSSRILECLKGYSHVRAVCGAAQGSARTLTWRVQGRRRN